MSVASQRWVMSGALPPTRATHDLDVRSAPRRRFIRSNSPGHAGQHAEPVHMLAEHELTITAEHLDRNQLANVAHRIFLL
ncbi:hypothetical protein, partial [Nannocystis sp.]|uniref:hypothetical protein n=1 Tax=Nannocystis sp. TaxID=1962667 RepID=UPI0025E9C796